MFNPTPQSMSQADVDAVSADIDDIIVAIKALNSTNTALTKKERESAVSVSVRRKAFLDHYFQNKDAAVNVPFKPSETLIPEADAVKHYAIHNQLDPLIGKLMTALELVTDMQLNSEHYSYNLALAGREAAAKAKKNGKPGADAWYDSLNDLFPKKGSRGVANAPDPA